QHLPVQSFHRRIPAGELVEIPVDSRTGQAGKYMVCAEEQLLLVQVRKQRDGVPASSLKLDMMAFFDSVNTHVQMSTAAGYAAHFFTQEKVRVAAQRLDCVDRVVIRHRHEIHAPPFE